MTEPGQVTLLDPTFEPAVISQNMAARPETLDGKTVALIANDKAKSADLLRAIFETMADRFELDRSYEVYKGDAGRPADPAVLDDVAGKAHVALIANGD